MQAGGLVTARKQGRHSYYGLCGPDVAGVLEALMGLAQRTGAVRVRTGPKDAALRAARVCYDHLAGERGVALLQAMIANGWLESAEAIALTPAGRDRLAAIGIEVEALERGRRPVCRGCLDWSERQSHLGGALGAACLELMIERGWARREPGRVVAFTPSGAQALNAAFEISPTCRSEAAGP
jgi:hypothetical protein